MGLERTGRFVFALWLLIVGVAGAHAADTPPRVAVVSLALWSDGGVFRQEAAGAARVIAARYRAVAVVVRGNTRRTFEAGPAGMVAAMQRAERGLDPARDVLFVVMTSHGSADGIAEKGGGREGLLAPQALGALLQRSRVQHKVLIVSACFSGIFTPLASPDLLVITAADATHPSFGCEAGARWTYFGRAFFDEALRDGIAGHAALPDVFAHAAALVRARELKDGFEPSNPQMTGGAAVLARLSAVATAPPGRAASRVGSPSP